MVRTLFYLIAMVSGARPMQSEALLFGVPPEIRKCLKPVEPQYQLSDRSNPFYLRGDFDGDGRPDYAVLITNSKDERGIAVCRAAAAKPEILGAGNVFHQMGDLTFG